jgi:CDGSH-type Zn-finger protein
MPATKVTVRNDGPLLIEGDLEVVDALGKAYGLAGRTAISLCRCGLSEKKPFCDGAHRRQGFQSSCEAHDLPPMQPKV